MRPLLLTGGPAAGKSTVAAALAGTRQRCAVLDVDDIRQLVVRGHAAPWQGVEGAAQQQLGIRNTCALARNFLAAAIDVVIADVAPDRMLTAYRAELPELRVVWLQIDLSEARRRARNRPIHLSWEEFAMLHDEQRDLTGADDRIDVTALSVDEVVRRITWP